MSGMITVTLYFMTILIVTAVMPQIQGTMSATSDEVSWVVTFYLLAMAIVTPMTGWLVTSFGRKRTMCVCIAGFGIATLMCGLSQSLEELVFWRIVQGGFSAPTLPLTQTVMLDIYPRELQRFAMGATGMGSVVGPVIGPAMAGWLVETYSWRYAFYIMVPVCFVALVGMVTALQADRPKDHIRLDWTGFLSLSVSVGCLQYVLSRGQRLDWFDSNEIVISAMLAALAFWIFLAHSLTSDEPFLDLRLLFNRNLTLGYILHSIFGMLAFTPMVLLPTLLRQHAEYPDTLVGWIVGSRGIGGLIGFFIAMWAERIDPRVSIGFGFTLLFLSGLWLMQINLDVTPLEIMLNGMLQGFSVGIVIVPLTVITFDGLDQNVRPAAMGMFHFLRNVASGLFISFSVAEVVRSTGANYARMAEMVSEYNNVLAMSWVVGAWDYSSVQGLMRLSTEMTRQAAMIGYLNAFGWFTLFAALALPFALLIGGPKRERP
ncbi:MAG: DHA2 family efflux MFS transporter permease subunit [Alphaproteobacteria bacterium]|nr:DHA2 family efflux MFS transporter permease subunit [Alphaproteobacteria bacterium]